MRSPNGCRESPFHTLQSVEFQPEGETDATIRKAGVSRGSETGEMDWAVDSALCKRHSPFPRGRRFTPQPRAERTVRRYVATSNRSKPSSMVEVFWMRASFA